LGPYACKRNNKPIEPAERRSFIEERSPKLQRIAADGHQLPLQAGVFDLLWSNGLLHWSKQWPELLAELHRCARQDALFSFSLLGVDSLSALRSLTPHLMTFPDMHDLGDALVHTGWAEPVVDMDRIVLTWRHPHDLLSDLRALGGHLNPSQAKHVRSRRWLTDVHQSLEYLRRPDGLFQLEIELILGHAWRAADAKQAAEWQPVQLKLKAS
jgi:malonyl-CoA O-methyltransferase